jgi:DNA-binding transcriptional MerR regulator
MLFSIQTASLRSGLTPHVIRIWERRYGALTPTRTGTNRRMYCDEEIQRLRVLGLLTKQGHRIGQIAQLEMALLAQLLEQISPTVLAEMQAAPDRAPKTNECETEASFVQRAIQAAKACDTDHLRGVLQQARSIFGQRCMIHRVICPLIQQVGESWRTGELGPCHEHLTTAVLREMLMIPAPGSQVAPSAPEVVVSTPVGESHELSALLVAASARDLGWRVTYLGPNLHTEEIAACAKARKARAVALSMVYPDRSPIIEEKLRKMRGLLPPTTALLIGDRAAASCASPLPDLDIQWANSLCDLDQVLLRLSSGNI